MLLLTASNFQSIAAVTSGIHDFRQTPPITVNGTLYGDIKFQWESKRLQTNNKLVIIILILCKFFGNSDVIRKLKSKKRITTKKYKLNLHSTHEIGWAMDSWQLHGPPADKPVRLQTRLHTVLICILLVSHQRELCKLHHHAKVVLHWWSAL